MPLPDRIVIASRKSRLALWQSEHVRSLLVRFHPRVRVEILPLSTRGDEVLDRSLAKIGGKGLFVKELEAALEDGRADIAVHSAKDVPVVLPAGFELAAILAREDPRDAFVSNAHAGFAELPRGAIVGTSSLRREAQLRSRYGARRAAAPRQCRDAAREARPGRLRCDRARGGGLKRLGLGARVRAVIDPEVSLPAAGQGRSRSSAVSSGATCANCSRRCTIRRPRHACTPNAPSPWLGGSCQVPLGAYGEISKGVLRLRGVVASPGWHARGPRRGTRRPAGAGGRRGSARRELGSRGADEILAALQ